MANRYIIRPAPRQDFGSFVRYIVGLAAGSRVDTDTSTQPYFVRVDKATYDRWVASLPKKQQPEPEPENAAAPVIQAEAAPPAAPSEPEPEPEPDPAPARKRTAKKTAKKRAA